ncbi:MAG TPA: glycosyltransferase [Aestuariivirga sp.]|nr:glycosyltransferase [Aestuariivirga sp.]
MIIAYLVNQYPKTSHSFIRREILALELMGLTVFRYTLRRTAEALADDADNRELSRTAAVISQPISKRALDALRTITCHPVRFAKAAAYAIRRGLKSDRSVAVHVAYLLEAAVVAEWCRRDRIDHLHVHFGTNSATVGMLVSRIIGLPWSFTAHGPEEFDRPLGIGLPDKIASAKFIVAISSFGRSQLWRWTEYKQWKKIHIVRCGLDAGFLEGARTPVPKRQRIVCVGRLCEQKGQLLLVEAARILKNRSIVFELVFAGDGPMRHDIEAAVASAGLDDCVSITGWVSGQRVREEIAQARALVLPSFAEGLPVVIMEALALERPVISTMVGGIPELVTPGETGWLVPAGDVEALARGIGEVLLLPPKALGNLGKRGRQRVLIDHNVVTEAAKLLRLFEGHGP